MAIRSSEVSEQLAVRELFGQVVEAFDAHPSVLREIRVEEEYQVQRKETSALDDGFRSRDSSELAIVEVTIKLRVPLVLLPRWRWRT